jgi:hypothetical protein
MRFPEPVFSHLRRLTDAGGLFEHAEGTVPRREHGYCVDDVARALVVTCRETGPGGGAHDDLRDRYLQFVLAAQSADGRFHNRRGVDLRWSDQPSVEDCWGRALWGLGTAAATARHPSVREVALSAFARGASWRSPWSRAMSFAAIGAAEVLTVVPDHREATGLLAAVAESIGPLMVQPEWPWPEQRLTYANAVVPEALLAAGAALGDLSLVADGLASLGWLLELQTRDGHLSVVPVGGRGPGDAGPEFDQQPIEVAALADACARAHRLTGDDIWVDGIDLSASWFLGANDSATPLLDVESGGGCDGLERSGRNENQGAESTLASISTLQHARALSRCA